jgi:hypothetical protein
VRVGDQRAEGRVGQGVGEGCVEVGTGWGVVGKRTEFMLEGKVENGRRSGSARPGPARPGLPGFAILGAHGFAATTAPVWWRFIWKWPMPDTSIDLAKLGGGRGLGRGLGLGLRWGVSRSSGCRVFESRHLP